MKLKLPVANLEKEVFYDFWRDGVTQSMLNTWLLDPVQAKLEYVDGWRAYEAKDYFVFGGIVHHVIEHILKDGVPPTTSKIKGLINGWMDKFEAENTNLTAQFMEELEETVAKANAVCNSYFKKYFGDFSKKWLCLETKFKIPYTYPDGKTTYLQGMIDIVELEDGYMVEYDTKSYARWSKEDALILLPVNIQLNFYGYALTRLFPEYKLKKVVYNVIKKPTHKWTAKEKTADEFQKKIEGIYNAALNDYFIRETFNYTNETALLWKETQLDPMMKQFRYWVESNYQWPGYYNPANLETKYGLVPMAKMIIEGDTMGYYKRKHPFSELV